MELPVHVEQVIMLELLTVGGNICSQVKKMGSNADVYKLYQNDQHWGMFVFQKNIKCLIITMFLL